MMTRILVGVVVAGLLVPVGAEAQNDGAEPTIEEPTGLNRDRWDALVFNGWFARPEDSYNQTIVLHAEIVPTIRICMQSPDESRTGERLAPYANAAWWREQIEYWTGINWNGEIRIAACTGTPSAGWIQVREGKAAEIPDGAVAFARSNRESHPHDAGRWLSSEIVWNPEPPEYYESEPDSYASTLSHEFGHVLGFSHVPPGSGGLMTVGGGGGGLWDEKESSLAQLAYRVGPNVMYPGLVRSDLPEGAVEDRAALTALYNATDGGNWEKSWHWASEEPLERWHGVTTDATGHVTELILHGNGLKGEIPGALGDLSRLTMLWLPSNDLTGLVPAELGKLSELRLLNLEFNNLTGPLPSSLTNLRQLELLNIQINAGLCAPADAVFRAWLATVGDFRGKICADEPTPTMLTLSAAPAAAEGGAPVTVTATLDNPAPANGMTVTLTTGGTATLDTDYTLSSTTITLAEGETAGTVTITVTDDAEDDAGETIVIDAESTSPALTAEPLTLTIEDNDEPTPTMLTLSAAPTPTEGGEPVTVTATLDNPAPANGMTVTLTTGGTATLDTDYTLSSTTITLAAGETAGTVTITVTDDAEDDAGETIVIAAESTNPALTAEPLTLTIEDNDVTPVPALPLGGAMLLGLLLTLLGAVRVRMRDRTGASAST